MGSINPFACYLLNELGGRRDHMEKYWKLEASIFEKEDSEVDENLLLKTSAEMFKIYKFYSNPNTMI